ncbi:hypothetical protein HYQ46_002577 [Verticillium longisporum]|nr:hypothetical protein HYQ46_002577 [Verticillium longisporum]
MVNFTFPVLAAVALAPLVAASPAAEAHISAQPAPFFSIEKWVSDYAENPKGDHLSLQEALDAFLAGLNSAGSENHASCDQLERQESRVTDAVNCIDQLRENPDNEITMTTSRQLYCAHGTAQIWGGAGQNAGGKTTFREIAETASRIMDSCTRADGWVQGTDDTTNGIAIHISSEFNA